ncbi:MAG: EAL domain-containing protein [Actinobacteria bacterium]|nr:EAL domain-containing protein [Actinomycetota bacterium]
MQRHTPDAIDARSDEGTRLSTPAELQTGIDGALRKWRRRDRSFMVLVMSLHPWGNPGGWLGDRGTANIGRTVTNRILAMRYPGDMVGQLYTGELAVLCEDVGGAEEATRIARRFAAEASRPLASGGEMATPMVSVGVAVGGGVHSQASEVLSDARIAMQRAAERPGSRVELFNERLRLDLMTRSQSLNGIARAVNDSSFHLLYQPIVSIGDERLVAAEALFRWDKVTPARSGAHHIIALAEETNWIQPLGRSVLHEACRQAAAWTRLSAEELVTYVNVSPQQFAEPRLLSDVEQALSDTGLEASRLGLEVTESSVVSEDAIATLHRLRELGIRVSLDDFGTGFSSLSALQRLPLDNLKLDRSFVAGLSSDSFDGSVVDAIVTLAHHLGLGVVAEGVETAVQLEAVRDLGCDFVQGFYLARPVAAEDLAKRITSHHAEQARPR